MTQSINDLFGASATESGNNVTVDLTDFVDSSGNVLIDDIPNASPAKKMAAWIAWLHRTQSPGTDVNGTVIVDQTQAVVPQASFAPKTFEVRNGVAQVKNEFNFALYAADNSEFDPDAVI